MNSAVDWALKANNLSILLYGAHARTRCRSKLLESRLACSSRPRAWELNRGPADKDNVCSWTRKATRGSDAAARTPSTVNVFC